MEKTSPSPKTARRLIFSGRVQGVGFRYTARLAASRLRLSGFVHNLPDGDVEVVVQGEATAIDRFMAELNDHFAANIRQTAVTTLPVNASWRDFVISY